MDQGTVKSIFQKAIKLDLAIEENIDRLQISISKIEKYKDQLFNYGMSEGYRGNDNFIEDMEEMIIKLKSKLKQKSSPTSISTTKLKWNANLNELAWLFDTLKNKRTNKTDDQNLPLNYIDATIEQLADFIYNNFDCKRMSKETIGKYLRDKKFRKKIVFSESSS